jgi:hypothetical protein
MRKVLLSLVAAAAIGAGFTMISTANAAPVTPSAMLPSIAEGNLTEDVQWRRRRCWHTGYYSRVRCVWRGGHGWRWSRRW